MLGRINWPRGWRGIAVVTCLAFVITGSETVWAKGGQARGFVHPHALPPHTLAHVVLIINGARNEIWFKAGPPDRATISSYDSTGRLIGHATIIGTQETIQTGPTTGTTLAVPAATAASLVDGSWAARERTRGTDVQVPVGEIVPEAAAPANLFTVPAHLSGLPRDPDGSAVGTTTLSVAQALAYTDRPGLVLAGDPEGLRLVQVTHVSTPQTAAVQFQYANNANQLFTVMLIKSNATPLSASDPMVLGPLAPQFHPDSFTVDGLTVNGLSTQLTTHNPDGAATQIFVRFYLAKTIGVKLASVGLTASAYHTVVAALVDGRQHSALVARLQQELDTVSPRQS